MKVKCIKKPGWLCLTIGKTYETIIIGMSKYKIINDKGEADWYPKNYFKTLSELRNETINKLLADES